MVTMNDERWSGEGFGYSTAFCNEGAKIRKNVVRFGADRG
jgi:hypothetical protein